MRFVPDSYLESRLSTVSDLATIESSNVYSSIYVSVGLFPEHSPSYTLEPRRPVSNPALKTQRESLLSAARWSEASARAGLERRARRARGAPHHGQHVSVVQRQQNVRPRPGEPQVSVQSPNAGKLSRISLESLSNLSRISHLESRISKNLESRISNLEVKKHDWCLPSLSGDVPCLPQVGEADAPHRQEESLVSGYVSDAGTARETPRAKSRRSAAERRS